MDMKTGMPDRIHRANIPTPLKKMARLSQRAGVALYFKRDDFSGSELSGNKIRKPEFLLADPLAAGADTVITSCSGCFKTINSDYPKLAGSQDYKVKHVLELIKDLISDGNLKFPETNLKVTYHDPCHLGRHSKMYDIPRDVLRSIPGFELVEMERNRENARCCRGGGGVDRFDHRMGIGRAQDVGARLADQKIVVHIAAAAGQQPRILGPGNRLADTELLYHLCVSPRSESCWFFAAGILFSASGHGKGAGEEPGADALRPRLRRGRRRNRLGRASTSAR